jgi:predicted DNA-binding transcriptional regulator AlpA
MSPLDDDLIPAGVACKLLGGSDAPIDQSTLYRWVKAGKISPPVKLGRNTARYRRSVILADRERLLASA